jgi:hypothetical protein
MLRVSWFDDDSELGSAMFASLFGCHWCVVRETGERRRVERRKWRNASRTSRKEVGPETREPTSLHSLIIFRRISDSWI